MGDGGGSMAAVDLLEASTRQQESNDNHEQACAVAGAASGTALAARPPRRTRQHLAPRRERKIPLVEPHYDDLRPFSGLYQVYYDAMRKEMWHVCALKSGRLVYPTVKYVPPCLAVTFLEDLADGIDGGVDIDDDEGRASILYSVKVISMEGIAACCNFEEEDPKRGFRQYRLLPRGAVAFVAALRVEFHESRRRTGVHRLEFLGTVWKLKPHGDLRPGTALTVPVNKYRQAAAHVKKSVLAMPAYLRNRLPQAMVHWAHLPLVDPVSRSDLQVIDGGGTLQFSKDELTPDEVAAQKARRQTLILSLRGRAAMDE